jgi:DnaJ like chaperone protein
MGRMTLTDELRKTAMRLHGEGKHGDFPFDAAVDRLRAECHGHSPLLRLFVELQTEAALADGRLHPQAESLLLRLCDRLNFSRFEFYGIRTRLEAERRFSRFGARTHQYYRRRYEPPAARAPSLTDAYATLGLAPSATDADIKRAYRRLISRHHPDKLAAQGVSEARMQKATEQAQKIQQAYDALCKTRKL